MPRATLRLAAPADFDLRSTIRSHGWSDLPPFETDGRGESLRICLDTARATVRDGRGGGVSAVVESADRLSPAARRRAAQIIASCLRFDLDLSGFWAICREDPALAWAARRKAGRFLRAPTAFGDAVMILATTNCSWAMTRRIVAALVACWGRDGALPGQARLARVREAELRRRAGLGYRAPYLAALARGPDLEPLRSDPSPTAELRRRLLALPGFGPYAAESMLRSLGRFEHLALDSWVTAAWKRKFPRRKATAGAIARRLARYGRWQGLAFWLTLTEPWYSREEWRL